LSCKKTARYDLISFARKPPREGTLMLCFDELAFLSNAALAAVDVAAVHLACAAGIPGSQAINASACIVKLDSLAAQVRRFTEDSLAAPKEQEESEARLRMHCLALVLWKGAGIRYNPDKIAEDAPWDLEDTFIHGALFGKGGTCATLPIRMPGQPDREIMMPYPAE
jgi:hypothetical protein